MNRANSPSNAEPAMTGRKPVFEQFAPAKINLYLHVGRARADGLHPLDSLTVFASIGDWVRVTPARDLSLQVTGPFAAVLRPEPDNLVLRAARLMAEAFKIDPGNGVSITLEKNLPIASGIGGGSADAAAALRALSQLWNINADLTGIARALGADVPACLAQHSAIMRGAGDELTMVDVPAMGVVLANTGDAVPTPSVYRRFDALGLGGDFAESSPPVAHDAPSFIAALAAYANDLEAPAFDLASGIADLKRKIALLPGCRLARMSGSGGTVFGLFADPAEAALAAEKLRMQDPAFWIAAGQLGGP